MKYILFLCTFLSFAYALQPEQWQTEMTAELTEKLDTEIAFIQSGPQAIFYADSLPDGLEQDILNTLNAYAGNEMMGGYITVVGLRPETAYRTKRDYPAERLTNTSIVAEYASLVDGRVRDIGSVAGQSFTGCISRSGADGASVRCSDGGSQTFQTRCQMYGGELVCRSTD